MPAANEDVSKANEILAALESRGDVDWLRQEGDNFDDELRRWVELAITQLVLIVGSHPVVFAQAVRENDEVSGALVVFTSNLVAVATVEDVTDLRADPHVSVVNRKKIRSLTVSGGARMVFTSDSIADQRAAMRWPGEIRLTISYDGLPTPVDIGGAGVNVHNRDAPSPIRELLSALRTDLEASVYTAHSGTSG